MTTLSKGKNYKLAGKKLFPFGEKVGTFMGVCPSGFYKFKLSGKREALLNPVQNVFEPTDEKVK